MSKKQIVVVIAVLAITGYLYSLDPKGLVKPKATTNNGMANADRPAAANITVATVSITAKAAIGTALSASVTDLENKLKGASGSDKLAIEKQLAKMWDDDNQPAPAAFYCQDIAKADNKFDDWLNTGSHFNEAYKQTQDTAAQAFYVSNAADAFQNALKQNAESLDAKMGLGIAYVNGAGMPMQGIKLLLEVVKQDPKNISANMNLGLFSIKSGQYDKAVDRFKLIIEAEGSKVNFEPYYYMAEAYTQLGKKPEAIAAYEKCKQLMPDPTFGQRIDEYIKELKS